MLLTQFRPVGKVLPFHQIYFVSKTDEQYPRNHSCSLEAKGVVYTTNYKLLQYLSFSLAAEQAAERATKKAAEKAAAETEKKSKLEDIHSLMETLNFTLQQAMDALKIPVEKQAEYRALI